MRNLEFLSDSSVAHSRVYIFRAIFCDAPVNGVSWNDPLNFGILDPSTHGTDLA
jgi:hypothetical protein